MAEQDLGSWFDGKTSSSHGAAAGYVDSWARDDRALSRTTIAHEEEQGMMRVDLYHPCYSHARLVPIRRPWLQTRSRNATI